MRVFTFILILTLTLGFLTTAESGYTIPKLFKNVLMLQKDWDVVGPFIEKYIPQWLQGAKAFPELKQMYQKVLTALSNGNNYNWRFKNLGLVEALKAFDQGKLEEAVFRNIAKLNANAIYSLETKIENALRFGVKVGGKPVEVTIEMIASEMGVAANVEGVSAIDAAIIGISEEEAASVIAACVIVEA